MKVNLLVALMLGSLSLPAAVVIGPAFNSPTRHFYSLISSNSWTAPQAEAGAVGGKLATINDAAGKDWGFDTFNPGPPYAFLGVVEQATAPFCTPHRATATASVVNGFVVDATITDLGCGYTNVPLVLIQGGGGSGATATAVINSGAVVGINITST